MAMTLAEMAKLSTDDLQAGVIETILEESYVLQRLPFENVSGNAYAYVQEATLPTVNFRAVNAGYTEATGTNTEKSESLKILGHDADVDRFIVTTQSADVAEARAEATRQAAKAVRMKFHDAFINGDGTGNSFRGVLDRVDNDAPAGNVIDGGTNGIAIVGADDDARHAFFDKLDELIAAVPGGPSVLLMNDAVLAKIRSSARRLTIYDETKDDFGRPISTYNGIPLVDVGYKADGTSRIIPQTDTQGTSTDASKIFAVRFGSAPADLGLTGLHNGGMQVYDLGETDDKPAYRTRIEWYLALANHGDRAVAYLEGVLAA